MTTLHKTLFCCNQFSKFVPTNIWIILWAACAVTGFVTRPLTSVWIGSAVAAERGRTAGSLFSKQSGLIGRVEKRLKQGVQGVRGAQRGLRPVGAWGAVTWRRAVGWGGSAAGRCQRCHSGGTTSNMVPLKLCWPALHSPGLFIKLWCIVGHWRAAINGSLSSHWRQECNGQTDNQWRPLSSRTHSEPR